MTSGIRATVEFSAPDICPIADISAREETRIESVDAAVTPAGETGTVTEFSVDAEPDADVPGTEVFSHGERRRYRLEHDGGVDCPCECLGAQGCPVVRYVASGGTLTLEFHAADYDELRTVVAALRERFPGVDLTRFVRAPEVGCGTTPVLVDRDKLTPRQLEVLGAATEMGYFERPRRCNATEIADELDINPSTFRQHLVAAESKIFEDVL